MFQYKPIDVAFGTANKWLVTLTHETESDQLRVFDASSGRVVRHQALQKAHALAVDPSRGVLAVSEGDSIVLYTPGQEQPMWRAPMGSECLSIQFAPAGNQLYAACIVKISTSPLSTNPLIVSTVDLGTGHEVARLTLNMHEHYFVPLELSVTRDAKWVAVVGVQYPSMGEQFAKSVIGLVRQEHQNSGIGRVVSAVFDVASGQKIRELEGRILALSGNAGSAVILTKDAYMIQQLETGKEIAPIVRHSDSPFSNAGEKYWQYGGGLWGGFEANVSPDGKTFLLYNLFEIQVLDAATGISRTPTSATSIPEIAILGAAIAVDSGQVALAQADNVLTYDLYAPHKQRLIGDPAGSLIPSDVIRKLILASKDSQLTDKERDRLIKKYSKRMEKAKGAEKQNLEAELDDLLNGHSNQLDLAWLAYVKEQSRYTPSRIAAAAVLPSGRFLAIISTESAWNIWDVTTGNRLPFNLDFDPTTANWQNRVPRQELSLLENRISGHFSTADVKPKSLASTDAACTSANGEYNVSVVWDRGKPKSLMLHSMARNRSDTLPTVGLDLSQWQWPTMNETTCSLADDGGRWVVAGPEVKDGKSKRNLLKRTFHPRPEDWAPKPLASLLIYDTKSGNQICALEKEPGTTAFDLRPGELKFSADGRLIMGGGRKEELDKITARNVLIWETTTCKLIAVVPDSPQPIEFSKDNRQYFTYATDSISHTEAGIRVWDTVTGKLQFEIGDIMPTAIETTQRVFIGIDSTSAVGIWDRLSGERLGTLRILPEGEWLVTTSSGLFDGSPRAWAGIAWRDSVSELAAKPAEIFFNEYFRPGLLAELLKGYLPPVAKTNAQLDRRQPTITLTTNSTTVVERYIKVQVSAEESPASLEDHRPNGGIRDIRLFRNGTLVKVWHGDVTLSKGKATFNATIPLVTGDNRLVAYGFNKDNIKSQDAVLMVHSMAPPRAGTAYILSIGINHYSNDEFDLAFAAPDAERVAAVLAEKQRALGDYQNAVTVKLLDREATRSNIKLALQRLAGLQEETVPAGVPKQIGLLHRATPEDVIIIYFSGHGLSWEDHFYLIPHDMGYAGARSQLQKSLKTVLEKSISDRDLENLLEEVDARHVLLVIDACNSGKILDSDDDRRGPMNNKGLAQLAYEKGMYILTAAQSYQAAWETSRLGHGYLTYALIEEGLEKSAADFRPIDGRITASEWLEFATQRVPQLQIEAIDMANAAQKSISFAGDRGDHRGGGLQVPRLFYRREDSIPLIITKSPNR